MSRIRSTLDTVTKAVGSAELISKISRLKLGSVGGATHAEKVLVKANAPAPEASTPCDMKPSGEEWTMEEQRVEEGRKEEQMEEERKEELSNVPEQQQMKLEDNNLQEKQPPQQQQQLHTKETPFLVPKHNLPSVAANTSTTVTSASAAGKQMFHPATLSANMETTYSSLAQHVTSYFGTTENKQTPPHMHTAAPAASQDASITSSLSLEQDASLTSIPTLGQQTATCNHIPVLMPVAQAKSIETGTPPLPAGPAPGQDSPSLGTPLPTEDGPPPPTSTASSKKGIGQYLSYPGPSVQAFVGSYIAPLVPKFSRGETKTIVVEKDSEQGRSMQGQETNTREKEVEEKKAAEQKAKEVLSQREKIIARMSVDNRTRALVKSLQRVTDVRLLTSRVEDLGYHLLEFPETRGAAIKERVLPCLLRLRQARDPALQGAVREALALLGYTDPVRGRGIRVLTIDGGGTRGMVALQTLHKLQELTGKPIHHLFDYICGVSTGAILAFMLGVYRFPLDECEQMYRKLGSDVFKQNVIVGTVKMGWSHAFYDSETWENILKERMGESIMVECARDPECPKVSCVSTIVNRGLPLKAYVFRNYSLLPGIRSHYLGDCRHKMWQAIRASSAAPGYFQEFPLGNDLHQDGGLLINNPTALAIHECKLLWPNTALQCVVSLGTGRHETVGKNNQTSTSLKAKITNVISSATDTEEVHTMLDALLPPDTYFRFNPYMSEDVALDESRPEKLNFLQSEGERYLSRNEDKLRRAAGVLGKEKSAIQRLAEWAHLKADMYDGLPFSKL